MRSYDVAVVGGGPAGATAARDLAAAGFDTVLLDKAGRIKPCGGAVPPRLLEEFDIPESLLSAKVRGARMISPAAREVHMPIGGWVGMVDREDFDEFLRHRAAWAGTERRQGCFEHLERVGKLATLTYRGPEGDRQRIGARMVIGADGALSRVRRQCVPQAGSTGFVFAYHEIVTAPSHGQANFNPACCDVVYDAATSPDFYAWVFPHGATASIGTGSAAKGFPLR
ncbi:MAG TPA: geranylgeranyl reductase family protein, partial [Acetobacteraceae bacterium]|nr:geranylgeranyl reductase family protein [Acetobacteraceae bacterium]